MSFSENKDCNTLRDDTILKMSVGRLPMTGNALASHMKACQGN